MRLRLSLPARPQGGGDGLSLQNAIAQSAESIARDIPPGTRVAVVAFESESRDLSEFIMNELAAELMARGVEVAGRRNLDAIAREIALSLDGSVSDETALSIGRMQAAEIVVTGQLLDLGNLRRFTVHALNAETAVSASMPRFDVQNNRALRNMAAALGRQPAQAPRQAAGGYSAPRTAGEFLDRGIMFLDMGEHYIAALDFTDALRLSPNLAKAYLWRGIAHRRRGELDLAIADFTQAIRIDPNFAYAFNGRGIAHRERGELDLAFADFTQAIRINPNLAYAFNNRGVAHRERGELDLAIADWEAALRLDPNHANPRQFLEEGRRTRDGGGNGA